MSSAPEGIETAGTAAVAHATVTDESLGTHHLRDVVHHLHDVGAV